MKQLELPMLRQDLYSIDMGKSGKLLRAFVETYNEGRPLGERIRGNHVHLMEKLLHIYRVNLWQQQDGGALLVPGRPLPYLETNNGQLRYYLSCTKRSVQHLRQRLKAAGLIVEEIWHGSNRNYEMRLNPTIIHLGKAGDKTNYIGKFSGGYPTPDRLSEESPRCPAGIAPDGENTNPAADIRNQSVCGKRENPQGRIRGTAKDEVGGPRARQFEASGDSRYGKNASRQNENFSSNCTQLKLVTNKLNELEVGNFAQSTENQNFKSDGTVEKQPIFVEEPSKAVENPPNSRSDEELAGYETIEDRLLGTPPRVAAAPPEGDMVRSDVVRGDVVRGEAPLDTTDGGKTLTPMPPETFAEVVSDLPTQLGRAIFREVGKLWEVALQELYAGEWIADAEKERAKARLAEYFIYASPKRYAAGTKEICERIVLVRKWIQRGRQAGQERWVPIPSVYFDYRNPRGFRITKAWYKSHLENRAVIADNIALAKAVKAYKRSVKEQAGHSHLRTGIEKTHSKPASPLQNSPVELYQQTVARLARRNEALAGRFQKAVLML